MAINIKNLEERIQKKVHLVDSNTSVDDLTDMVEASLLLTGSLKTYADSSELPTAAGSNEKIGFIQDIKAIKFNNGKEWVTTASGEVQAPTGPGAPAGTSTYYGTNFGYSMGGVASPFSNNTIQKISFASDGNATDQGNLISVNGRNIGGGSTTHAYNIAGSNDPTYLNSIEKFSYASGVDATDTGNDITAYGLRNAHNEMIGNRTDIYAAGGQGPTAPSPSDLFDIRKFPAASDGATVSLTGDLLPSGNTTGHSGHSSTTHGYMVGSSSNVIQKFPFASDGNATDVADLNYSDTALSGTSSADHGYTTGGSGAGAPNYYRTNISKFTFASDANATDVGDKQRYNTNHTGVSASDYGYICGGFGGPGGGGPTSGQTYIEKYSHTSDGNSTVVGDMTAGHYDAASSQH